MAEGASGLGAGDGRVLSRAILEILQTCVCLPQVSLLAMHLPAPMGASVVVSSMWSPGLATE